MDFDKKVIFIVGTGRSGTHLIGRTLGSDLKVEAFIESTDFFQRFTELAVQPNSSIVFKELKRVIESYKEFLNSVDKNIILEKTHPNLWHAEALATAIPNSYFVAIKRNVYATVSSMLEHGGILNWYSKLPLDKPNSFLGITPENSAYFKDLPIESKCALRWKSHMKEIKRLEDVLQKNYLVIDYEDFYTPSSDFLHQISEMLSETFNFKTEKLNEDGKDKWKQLLNQEQINNIRKVIYD